MIHSSLVAPAPWSPSAPAIGRAHAASLAVLGLAVGLVSTASRGVGQSGTTMVSVLGNDNFNSHGARPSISADGRYVAFVSGSVALVPGDTNGQDVFVKDLQTGTIERVSVATGGAEGNGNSFGPAISPDARYVAFASDASNLVPGDTNDARDVFVHDRVTGVTERVSIDSSGVEGNGLSYEPAISRGGQFVAFTSLATNLHPSVVHAHGEVFVRDRVNGTTEIISISPLQTPIIHSNSYWPGISDDGRYVTFSNNSTFANDGNGLADVFVRDRSTGALLRASQDGSNLGTGDGGIYSTISADGRFVAFYSGASNLVPGDSNGFADIFVKDMQSGAIERVSVDGTGGEGNGDSIDATISGNGRFVAFSSGASNLVAGDTNGVGDVFVHDRQAHTTERVSVSSAGDEGNDHSGGPPGVDEIALSADGHLVVFASHARNLVPNDINQGQDVFARTLNRSPVAHCVAAPVSGPGASGHDITVECNGPDGREITLDASGSSDPDDDPLSYHWDVSDLSVVLADENAAVTRGRFRIGVTMATVTVTDGRGGVATCTATIRVEDTRPPDVECSTSVAALWPPRHDMRAVVLTVRATDACSLPSFVVPIVVRISSDEPDDAAGDGDGTTTGDVHGQDGYAAPVDVSAQLVPTAVPGTWTTTVLLRAERAGSGDGRKYTLEVAATDSALNIATASCVVVVPHDRRPGS